MFNCNICHKPSQGKPKRHTILKPNGQTAKELQLCLPCCEALDRGIPLNLLQANPARFHEAGPLADVLRTRNLSLKS